MEEISSINATTVVKRLNNIISTFGIPEVIRTDNGPPFNSRQFADNAVRLGFRHRKITPLWPEANGEAERFMRTLKKAIATAKLSGLKWEEELHNFLRNYRSTIHPAIAQTPAEALFGRNMSNKLPDLSNSDGNTSDRDLRDKDIRDHHQRYTTKLKQYADKKRKTKEHTFQKYDIVVLRNNKKIRNKLSPKYDTTMYIVKDVKHDMLVLSTDGKEDIVRNVSAVKRWTPIVNSDGNFQGELSDTDTEPLILFNRRNSHDNGNNLVVQNQTPPVNAHDINLDDELPATTPGNEPSSSNLNLSSTAATRQTPPRCTVRSRSVHSPSRSPTPLLDWGQRLLTRTTPERPASGYMQPDTPNGQQGLGRGRRVKKSTKHSDFVYN